MSNRLNIEKKGMKHYIPEKRKQKRLSNFIYSEKEDKLICQEGYSSIGKTRQKGGYTYYFSARSCRECQRQKTCSTQGHKVLVYVSDSHLLHIKSDPKERKEALKTRKRIEAKFGQAKKHHFLARARYRGRWRVAIQVFMTFLVMNLKRMIKLLYLKENRMKLALSSG